MLYFEIKVSQTQGQSKSLSAHSLSSWDRPNANITSLSSEMDCSTVTGCWSKKYSRVLSVTQASVCREFEEKKYQFFLTKLSQWVSTRFRLTFSRKMLMMYFNLKLWYRETDCKASIRKDCKAIRCLLTLKDNYYANYLTGAWISSFDPSISQGEFSDWLLGHEGWLILGKIR